MKKRLFLFVCLLAWPLFPGWGEVQIPPDARVVDITQPPYNADKTGGIPIDSAFQQVLAHELGSSSGGLNAYDKSLIIYFPDGAYKIDNTLKFQVASQRNDLAMKLGWRAHITIQGQSRDSTIFFINGANFSNAGAPKPVFYTASFVQPGPGGGDYNGDVCEGNTAFNNCFSDLTINTGTAAGAVGIDYLGNNQAAIRNVKILGNGGHTGIQMNRKFPGPLLIKNVFISGYEYGITCNQDEYSLTLEDITVENAGYGIYNSGNLFGRAAAWNIRNLTTANIRNASVKSVAQGALLTVVGARLGRSSEGAASDAIESEGPVYLREAAVTASYASVLRERGESLQKPAVKEYFSDGVKTLFPGPRSSLNLPVRETPAFEDYDFSKWQKVTVAGDPWAQTADNTAAVQAAFTAAASGNKHTIYFPRGRYNIAGTIAVPSSVRRIVGYRSILTIRTNIAGLPGSDNPDNPDPIPMFRIAGGPEGQLLVIEGLSGALKPSSDPNYAAGVTWFSQEDLRTVVLRDCWFISYPAITYRTKLPAGSVAGQLFVENTMTGRMQFNSPQNVWARQLNSEPKSADVDILNQGGRVWVLGLKTETPWPVFKTVAGGMSEILGGFHFPVQSVNPWAAAYETDNAHQSMLYATHSYSDAGEYFVHVREARENPATVWEMLKADPRLLPRGTSRLDHILPFFSGAFVSLTSLVQGSKGSHSLALDSLGRLWAWGENADGQLGYGGSSRIPRLSFAPSASRVAAFSGGGSHTLAADNDGRLWSWGKNSDGQLGGTSAGATPAQIPIPAHIKSVAAGLVHSVALDMDGFVWTWGGNASGQLGQNPADPAKPSRKTDLDDVVAIACGDNHTVALRGDGTVVTWGDNSRGQLGNGNTDATSSVVHVAGLSRIAAIAAGRDFTVALKDDGAVYAWGGHGTAANGEADLLSVTPAGQAPLSAVTLPAPVLDKDGTPFSQVAAIAAGAAHIVALKSNGSVWTWGRNDKGQLAMDPPGAPYRGEPGQVDLGGTPATSVGAGSGHTLILRQDGSVVGCGENGSGQLGDGTVADSPRLVPVSPSTGMNLLDDAPAVIRACLRKNHAGTTVDFDLTGEEAGAVESRRSVPQGSHTLILEFDRNISGGQAVIEEGSGSVQSVQRDGNLLTVSLAGVGDRQRLALRVSDVTGPQGETIASRVYSLRFLAGDVNRDGIVNSADLAALRSAYGKAHGDATFDPAKDVNTDGAINSGDLVIVRQNYGTSVP